jgi:quercetin dioxygenase-like cupin family protein
MDHRIDAHHRAPMEVSMSAGPMDEPAKTFHRIELQRPVSSIPGRDFVQALTVIPPGTDSGWHIHAGEEVGYVLAGTVEITVEGGAPKTLRPGDTFFAPPRTPHIARHAGDGGIVRMVSTYVIEAGQPLVILVG